jgi:serine/threonine protein kinase
MSAAHSTDPQGHGFEGRLLGGFRMVREIACGGMATVYLAHKAGPAGFLQPAAVKVIHPHLARDREFVEMFLDEARIVSCINHPNVCRVLDFGKAEGTYYLAMEYVMGETWGDVLSALKQRPTAQGMIPALLAQVLAQACEGLHAAHDARDPGGRPLSIVHRDISPQNLIVGYDGSVRVLDFGIASAAERLHTTRNGTIKGRFAYMAPEQMRGLACDRRADLWSLGVVLWEGLAQKRLFKRDTEAETVLAVTQDPLPSLAECGHPVPNAMARIALSALSRDREQRYGSAREMGLELSRFAGSSLVPVGMAEVSLWMGRLFGDRIEQKRGILRDAARRSDTDKASLPSVPPDALFSTTVVTEDPPLMMSTSGSNPALPSVSTVREVSSALIDLRPRSRWTGPLVGILAFLAVAAVGMYVVPMFASTPRVAENTPSSAPTEEHLAAAQPAPEPAVLAEPAPEPVAEEPAPEPVLPAENVEPSVPTSKSSAVRSVKPAHSAASHASEPKPVVEKKKKADPNAFGSINVVTPGGWADVYMGAKKLGTTPGRFELPVGAHTLRLRPFGKQPEITRKVEVTQDQAVKLKIPLE